MLNTSPEPFSNGVVSLIEDGLVVGALALAIAHPWLALGFGVGLSLLLALGVWVLWRRLWRGLRRLGGALTGSGAGPPAPG